MDYQPSQPAPDKLNAVIWKHFADVSKPDSHFTKWRGIYAEEFNASENIDLETATIEDIRRFYESNTFYARLGYKYRFPRMFSLLCRLGPEAAQTDFVDAFYQVNLAADRPEYFATYTAAQKYCVWLVYDCLDLHFGTACLFDHDAKRIKEQVGGNQEVVDTDAILSLSKNLFGRVDPPLAAIREFGVDVCGGA